MWTPSTDRYLLIVNNIWFPSLRIFLRTTGHLDELQGAQSRQSPLKLTPQLGRHKSQSGVSGSVVYKKTPGLFKIGKEREEKVRWQKAPRAHYELAMSDELFRDSKGPAASRFIDCSKKKVPIWGSVPTVYSSSPRGKNEQRSSDFGQAPVDLRPVGDRGGPPQRGSLLLETIMEGVVNY